MRRLIKKSRFPPLIFAFFCLTSCSAICFASEINNSALISYKIGNLQQQVSTNSTSTSINTPSSGTIIAPQNNSQIRRNFTVFGQANSQIDIKVDGLMVASTTPDVDGDYAVGLSLLPGTHTLTVVDGGVEGETVTIEVYTDSLPIAFPEISSPTDGSQIQTRRPTMIGKATPNSSVTVYSKTGEIESVGIGTTDSSGNFSIILNQDLSSGTNQLFVINTTFNLASEICEVIFIDPEGVVFDSVSNNPIKGAQVTLYNAATNQPCTAGAEIAIGDTNPYTTGTDGHYSFDVINGNYYLRVSASGYTFPSTLSSFPRTTTDGSKGEQFTVDEVLTINLPMDAQNSLLKIGKDANKREAEVGGIITYTVTIRNETAGDITNVYVEDKIPPGFKYISGKAIVDNVTISDPTGNRPLTFNVGTIATNTTKTLKYQLVVGSGVTFGNYKNSCFAKYSDGTMISNTATETVKIVPDPLFDLGTVIGKVFNDVNENGIQDNGEETIPYVRIVTEEGTVITTDKDGKWHLPGVTPGRHLFTIDESTLPEGAYLTTEEVALVDITNGILSKVNFGVKVPLDRLKELKETKGLDLQIVQEKSSPRLRLNVALYPEKLEIKDDVLMDKPIFKIFTNYHLFIKKWKLEIFEKDTNNLFKKFEDKAIDYENTLVWDGRSDKAELVKAGETYYYILTVWDDKGNFDVTAARDFNAEEIKKEERFKKSVIEIQDKEKEFEDWNKFQRQLNDLDKQTIIVKGETIRIRAQGQREKTKLKLNLDNQISLSVPSRKEIDAEIILPNGTHKLELIQDSPQGEPESLYEKQIKVSDSYLFFIGLADIKAGYTFNKGDIESAQQDDKFRESFWKEGKLAYYLKGKIKGKYLITSSLDRIEEEKNFSKLLTRKNIILFMAMPQV